MAINGEWLLTVNGGFNDYGDYGFFDGFFDGFMIFVLFSWFMAINGDDGSPQWINPADPTNKTRI
jgi:hypothetical protein